MEQRNRPPVKRARLHIMIQFNSLREGKLAASLIVPVYERICRLFNVSFAHYSLFPFEDHTNVQNSIS